MTEQSDGEILVFRDDKDWLEAALFLVFLTAFPLAILALWRQPAGVVPVYVALPFTAIFLVTVPFLVGRVRAARTRHVSFDRVAGVVEVVERRPWRRDRTRVDPQEIDRVVFNTTDNDGFWFTARLVLSDGRGFTFAQGSWRPDVWEKYQRLAAALQQANPGIRLVETSD